MQLELIEKLAGEDLLELHAGRLLTDRGPALVTVRRLRRQLVDTAEVIDRLVDASGRVGSLRHTNLLNHLGLFEGQGSHLWLSARTEGFDLGMVFQRLASREVRIPPIRALQIGVDLLEGLAALHEAGLGHGGLGPRHVLVGLDGVTRVDGFGYEQVVMSTKALRQKARRGGKDHLAPEVMTGRTPEPTSDVFSAAALVYTLLTGSSPSAGQGPGMSTRHQAVLPPSKRDRALPYACDAVFLKALSTAPRQRHESATALRNAMNRLRKSLLSGSDDGRDGVAQLAANLFPNEANVVGMPNTLERPAKAGPIALVALSAGDPAAFDAPSAPERDAAPMLHQPAAVTLTDVRPTTLEHQQPIGARTGEPTRTPGPPTGARPASVARHQTIDDGWVPSLDSEEANEQAMPTRVQPTPDSQDTVAMALPIGGDTEVLPAMQVPPPPPVSTPKPRAANRARSNPKTEVQSPNPWTRPAFLVVLGALGLAAVVLGLMASGLIFSEPAAPSIGSSDGDASLIAFLTVEASKPVRVTLDGEQLPAGAQLKRRLIRAGRHRLLVKSAAGDRLIDEVIEINPGEHREIRVVVPHARRPSRARTRPPKKKKNR